MENKDLHALQLELEAIDLAGGINRYRNAVSIRGHEATPPGQRLIRVNVEPLALAIEEWFDSCTAGDTARGKKAGYFLLVKDLEPGAMAYLTVRTVIALLDANAHAVSVSRQIGQAIESHAAWLELERDHGGLAYTVERQMKETGNEKHRKAVASKVTGLAGISKWAQKDCIAVGRIMLELLAGSSDLIELINEHRKPTVVRATPAALDFLLDGHARCEELTPMAGPMVCKPRAWTNPYDGGYLSTRHPLVRTTSKLIHAELENAHMPQAYRALNAMQDTAYSVNDKVLAVMGQVWDAGGTLGDVPARDDEPLPEFIEDDSRTTREEEEYRKQHRARSRVIHRDNHELVAHRLRLMRTLRMANKFSHYDAIYFPYNLDWRGRVYPLSTDLQPQGDDFAKALLQFAEGKPIGEDGFAWLKVHLANTFGVDKVSMEDRIKWVDDNSLRLMECAASPLEEHFWCLEDDGKVRDDSWQCLAACFEYTAVIFNGLEYKSKLIIAVDGSCNGLQHLSAMLRDPIGGEAVNLVPKDKPSDLYTQVAELTQDKLSSSGHELADAWEGYGVSRKLVKRNTMTRAYGVTQRGMRDQLVSELRNKTGEYWPMVKDMTTVEISKHAEFMAGLIFESINEVVVASKDVMDWLHECTRLVVQGNKPLHWMTPVGFPVMQDYRQQRGTMIHLRLYGQQLHYKLNMPTDDVNKRKSATATSPNLIHSLDAAHLMWTITAGLDAGIHSFAMIHDSFGTHAADIAELGWILREQFVRLYQDNMLDSVYQQFLAQAPADCELPMPPELGDLDIDSVMNALYFFA